jgi:rubrerythrin
MATDADAEREAVAQEIPVAPDARDAARDDARGVPWWTFIVVICALLSATALVGRFVGVGPAILVLAATALLCVVGFLFRAVQSVAEPHEDEDALSSIPPSLAEEQKRAALRALKELEFEKSVGNISPDDYAVIVERYREEAKRAMRAVDEERKTMRERAEKIAKKAVRAEVGEEASEPTPAEKVDEPSDNLCAKCGKNNDEDARFCKACGAPMGDVA